jgi:hypothetical protein
VKDEFFNKITQYLYLSKYYFVVDWSRTLSTANPKLMRNTVLIIILFLSCIVSMMLSEMDFIRAVGMSAVTAFSVVAVYIVTLLSQRKLPCELSTPFYKVVMAIGLLLLAAVLFKFLNSNNTEITPRVMWCFVLLSANLSAAVLAIATSMSD